MRLTREKLVDYAIIDINTFSEQILKFNLIPKNDSATHSSNNAFDKSAHNGFMVLTGEKRGSTLRKKNKTHFTLSK